MINHARTLLLNQPGKNYQPGFIGEEYTPRNYVRRQVPSYVLFPHKILFGSNPDKVFLNFRAAELLSLIHATELSEFVHALDSRITYAVTDLTDFFSPAVSIALNKTGGYTRTKMFLTGQPKADNSRGKSFGDYSVQLFDYAGNTSAVITSAISFDSISQPLEFSNQSTGLSNPVKIPGSNLSAQFLEVAAASAARLSLEEFSTPLLLQDYDAIALEGDELLPFTATRALPVTDGAGELIAQWQLQTYARPGDAISVCLPKLELLGEPLFLELFGVRDDLEPYATFKNIWFDHPMPNYRLAAFVLAMIYRTEETQR
jgi:hypothetical protein